MKESPILMNAEMVRQTLAGAKTMTRRIVKPQPVLIGSDYWWASTEARSMVELYDAPKFCTLGGPGDRLWVRENFTYWENPDALDFKKGESLESIAERTKSVGEDFIEYCADGHRRSLGEWAFPHPVYEHCIGRFGKVTPSIHMPRWASRITLEMTDVRVQRLRDISEEDAKAEGAPFGLWHMGDGVLYEPTDEADIRHSSYKQGFGFLWTSIYGRDSWTANPFVWAIAFRKV